MPPLSTTPLQPAPGPPYQLTRDPTFYSLVAANLITLYLVFVGQLGLANVLWVYWAQSVIIGAVNVVRILTLRHYSTSGLLVGDKPVAPNPFVKVGMAVFFCFHYGTFHLVYAVFLAFISFSTQSFTGSIGAFWLATGGFAVHHLWSFIRTRRQELATGYVSNLGHLMFKPYLRIIPMHLTILAAFGVAKAGNAGLIASLFTALKLISDTAAHYIEHRKSAI